MEKDFLSGIFIGAPCSMPWQEMEKTCDEKRLCTGCDKYVYDLSQLTRSEANKLLEVQGDRVCLILERDKNEEIITKDSVSLIGRSKTAVTKIAASVLGLLISTSYCLAKEPTQSKVKDSKKKTESNLTKKLRDAKLKLFEKPLPPGRICPPTLIKNSKNKNQTKASGKDSSDTNTGQENLNPSWLTDKRARNIAHDWPKKLSSANADKRAFILYQLARHHEARGNSSFALKAYKRSLALLQGKKYDPKFRQTVESQYKALLEKQPN